MLERCLIPKYWSASTRKICRPAEVQRVKKELIPIHFNVRKAAEIIFIVSIPFILQLIEIQIDSLVISLSLIHI